MSGKRQLPDGLKVSKTHLKARLKNALIFAGEHAALLTCICSIA